MNPFATYLHEQLEEKLKERRVVVWYDPHREFVSFVDALAREGDEEGLPLTRLGGAQARLALFKGSYFALRMQVEPLVSPNRPPLLLIYLPGEKRDPQGSVLMELEKAGTTWEPQLKRLARNVMRTAYSDGVIDEMLAPEKLTLSDVMGLLEQGGKERGSLLHVVFGTSDNVAVVAQWIADPSFDPTLQAKGCAPELIKLIESRAGLSGLDGTALAAAREKTGRYLLLSEFREDLAGEPPATIAMIPAPSRQEQRKFCREVLDHLRTRAMPVFEQMADAVEQAFGLAEAGLKAEHLGTIDTFRFEERVMLRRCGEVLAAGRYAEAAKLVEAHSGCFWARLDFSRRQAQWEVCALQASLGAEAVRVEAELSRLPSTAASRDLVQQYIAADGWHRMDFLQRRLLARVSRMEEDPETEQALNLLEARVESVLRSMAVRFGQSLIQDKWSVPGILHQTGVWKAKVAPLPGKVAVFHVDALRFEMGSDLAGQIPEAQDLQLEAAMAVLPSITRLGMAALLPGAAESYSVVDAGGKVGARIGSQVLSEAKGRMDYLKATLPEATDITLERLLQDSPSKVQQKIGTARVLVVRSQEIDALGEKNELLARNVMDTVIGNLGRAVRRLAGLGFERFVVTADHGHQFAARKEDDMKIDAPAGGTVELHRRCWIGKGVTAPAGTITVKAPELGYDSNLEFVFPRGLGVFNSGGGLAYHHGGCSLQEMVIPVISFRMKQLAPAPAVAQIRISEHPDTITNRTFGVKVDLETDLIRTEPLQVRVVLISGGEQVGHAGMVLGAEFTREKGTFTLQAGGSANIAMVLTRDDVATLRVVVQDAATGSVLHETKALPVQLKS